MRKYLAIFQIGIKDAFQYRGQLFFWVVNDAIFLIVLFYVWQAIFSGRGQIQGYSFNQLITYYVLVFFVEMLAAHYTEYNMEDIVRNGKLTKYLVRPMSFFFYRLANELGWRISKFAITAPLYIAIFYFLRDYFVWPGSVRVGLAFALSVAVASMLYFMVSYLISLTAFWLLKISSIVNIIRYSLIPLLSGILVPLEMLPPLVKDLVSYLPFQYLLYFPVKVYLGQITGPQYWTGLAAALLWTAALGAVIWSLWPQALRKYESVGG